MFNTGCNRIKPLCLPFVALYSLSHANIGQASPWLEANDPFMRSSVVALSDAGILSGPTNIYPLRWSLINDRTVTPDSPLVVELSQFRYSQQNAQLNRGNRRFALSGGNEQTSNTWYSDVERDKWAVEASYEHLSNSYAFRLNTVYLNSDGESEFSFRDSYFAINAGELMLDVGSTPRWWGQGWNHNLILATDGHDLDANVSLIGEASNFGVWSANLLFSKLDNKDYGYRASAKLVNKLNSWFEIGLAQHYWFEVKQPWAEANPNQLGLDFKLSLPEFADVYHSVYAEFASSQMAESDFVGASLFGWSGLKVIGRNSVRFSIEHQSLSEQEKRAFQMSSQAHNYLQTSYLMDSSWSVGSYIQLSNDHKLSLVYSYQNLIDNTITEQSKFQFSYQLPALNGLLKFSADAMSPEEQKTDWSIWSSYEFRF